MSQTYRHNLRLVVSGSLITVWAYSHMARTPVLGDMILPFVAAFLMQPRSFRTMRKPTRRNWAIACLFVASLFVLGYFVPTRILDTGLHSPWIVGSVWLACLAMLARLAAERDLATAEVPLDPTPCRDSI